VVPEPEMLGGPRSGHTRSRPTRIYLTHLTLCSLPLVLSSVWLLAGPVRHLGSITLVATRGLLLPVCDTLWYRFGEFNTIVETWAGDRRVSYHDLLPALVGRDIRQLRRSSVSIHFTDDGHRLVAVELKRLVEQAMDDTRLRTRVRR
jgi:hypothetical protein